jgi:hypothetical protein
MPGNIIARALLRVGMITLTLPTLAQACAVCVGSSPEDAGYFWGVLFLMSMPFAVAGLIGGWVWYHFRRGADGPISTTPRVIVAGPRGRPVATASTSAGPHNSSQTLQA